MVTTSFSSKMADYYRAGRPILVFGPADASVPRYFRKEQLPLCATSPAELRTELAGIDHHDGRIHKVSATREGCGEEEEEGLDGLRTLAGEWR